MRSADILFILKQLTVNLYFLYGLCRPSSEHGHGSKERPSLGFRLLARLLARHILGNMFASLLYIILQQIYIFPRQNPVANYIFLRINVHNPYTFPRLDLQKLGKEEEGGRPPKKKGKFFPHENC